MLLVNTASIAGREIQMLEMVMGSTVQTKHLGQDITQGLKTIVGGELKVYNDMMQEARNLATERMVAAATQLGADAIVNVRYTTSAIMNGAAEVMVYGTAVTFH